MIHITDPLPRGLYAKPTRQNVRRLSVTRSEIEHTCAQYREPTRIAGAATLWLVFYGAVIGGALWHAGDPARTARLSPEQARATVAQPEPTSALARTRGW
jgi:hypothetical protein